MKKNGRDSEIERYALDGGVLIALTSEEETAKPLKEKILEYSIMAFASDLALTELTYILCRKFGWDAAIAKKQLLLNSNMITIIKSSDLIDYAAKYKCSRAIALANCFTLALAKLQSYKALFVREEAELKKEMKKNAFDVEIIFLVSSVHEESADKKSENLQKKKLGI